MKTIKFKKLALFISVVLVLNACFFHYIAGDEARIQVQNFSEKTVHSIWIGEGDNAIYLGSKGIDIAPEGKSKIYTLETLGMFELKVLAGQDTLKKEVEIMGNSYRIVVRDDSFDWNH